MVGALDITCSEPRLRMTRAGRFVIRLTSYSFYSFMTVFIGTALLSDVLSLKWIALLLALIGLDRLSHVGHAERSLLLAPKHGRVNAALYLAPQAFHTIAEAFESARSRRGDFELVLFERLLGYREIKRAFLKIDVDMSEFRAKLGEHIVKSVESGVFPSRDELLRAAEEIITAAFDAARRSDAHFIELPDLLTALGGVDDQELAGLFDIFEITPGELEHVAILSRFAHSRGSIGMSPSALGGFGSHPRKIRHRVINRAWTSRPTPTLDAYGEDITDLARIGLVGFMIGHEAEYERVVDVLAKGNNPNVLLVGDPGVGKHTLVSHLAHMIVRDHVPPPLFDKRIVSVSIGSLIAGTDIGKLAERLKKILYEVADAGNVILCIPDIHNLGRTSGALQMSAADILLPAIKGTTFSVIGGTYPLEFRKYVQPNSDFVGAFEVVHLAELSEEEAMRVLVYASILFERQYRIAIDFPAIRTAVTIAHKYFRGSLLPASAEELLKEALASCREKRKRTLDAEDIIAVAEHKINIPLRKVIGSDAATLLHLESIIHERFINQDDAVTAVARSLREYRSGLSRKGGPIATFLFVGPTGVGKTELSKIVARLQFGSSEFMIRFDMSEYQEKQSITRLIGSPDGTVSGSLTDAVREKPYSLLLLDEFEKAHPDILNLFLQVFDDGRLTDSTGRVVDFQNTIIIATSNAHSVFIQSEIANGVSSEAIADGLKKKLTDYFKPELLNRFSQIIVFRSLSKSDVAKIARLLLQEVAETVKASHAITLNFDDATVQKIAEMGYDPTFGARPLRAVISERVRSVLAEKILRNEVQRGDTITLSLEGDALRIHS